MPELGSGEEASLREAGEGGAKTILMFSDGAGNSSAQFLKTTVWRTYEAADLGPNAQGKRKRIAFYDDGVGTLSFLPLAMLGWRLRIQSEEERV